MALDPDTFDLILTDSGIARVDEGRFVVQNLRSKLQTIVEEWALNPTLGWIELTDFERNPDLFAIEMRARKVILSTPNVLSIDELSMNLARRKLTLDFKATTSYGEIDLTVPWSVAWQD